jgi:AcrR family transcriptional regulator
MKQPLIVYHFGSKEGLWQAAVEEVWRRMESTLRQHAARRGLAVDAEAPLAVEDRETLRIVLRSFLASVAEHPEYLRIHLREGCHAGPRLEWLLDHHTRRDYRMGLALVEAAQARGILPPLPAPHLIYILIGALTFVFAVEASAQQQAGFDPRSETFLDAHVDAVLWLLAPEHREAAGPTGARPV